MLKIMVSVLFLLILCSGYHFINGEALQCQFGDVEAFGLTFYSCSVTALETPNDNNIITRYNGVHTANKYDKDVKQIYIHDTNTKYISKGLGSLFNLVAFIVHKSQLTEIRSRDFQGMQNLELLSLWNNKLTSVTSDTFSTLTKLKEIWLNLNQIKYIGSGAFDQQTNLNYVRLSENICANKDYRGSTDITQMKKDIKLTCDKPNDVIEHEIIKEIRDESTKNQEEIKTLNEMVKQLLKATEDHQKERQQNIKLRAELSIAKNQQNTAQDENDQLIVKLSKAKRTIEDFYMEVMDLKIERHNERQNSIALRSKLMEANEQLAECQINERISC